MGTYLNLIAYVHVVQQSCVKLQHTTMIVKGLK